MTADDFAAARTVLGQARTAADADEAALSQAREALHAANNTLADFDRTRGTESRRSVLVEQQSHAAADLAAAQSARVAGRENASAALWAFVDFTDPRTNLGLLADDSPIVMLPVRIETRFAAAPTAVKVPPQVFGPAGSESARTHSAARVESASASSAIGHKHRLLVRIYPDDCSIDTFEPLLSATELASAKKYWLALRTAGADEDGQRAAWRSLVAAHGSGRAAWIVDHFEPTNAAADPVFPPDPPTKQASWSQAPRVRHFPERFVVVGYSAGRPPVEAIGAPITLPLYVGPDPGAEQSETIHPDATGGLHVPDELAWMVDFDAALARGLAVSVPLTADQARTGFDRLLVVGVHMAQDATAGGGALSDLLDHHRTGRNGVSIVAQGTPTHNMGGKVTGYTKSDDPDASFDDRKRLPLFTPTADPWTKRDGQWAAEALGVDPALFTSMHGADGMDQAHARAMQRALFPATAGYWMDAMMSPVFSDGVIAETRAFFTEHVSGRGSVPALRIGGQPYGILPTTAFSRVDPPDGHGGRIGRIDRGANSGPNFTVRLFELLKTVGQTWTQLSGEAAHIGATGDAHQVLLDVVGLQASSVEFYSRYAESVAEMFNVANLSAFGPRWWEALTALGLEMGATNLLTDLGYRGTTTPQILQQYFHAHTDQLTTVVDDVPLSESRRIRPYTDDGRDYITWLIDAAKTSHEAIVAEQGFSHGASPKALLYRCLRHAAMYGYYNTSYRLHKNRSILDETQLAALKPEPAFIHIDTATPASESRFALLERAEPRITSHPTQLIADYITLNLPALAEAAEFREQLDSLTLLAQASTAQLERAFAEHIDICEYRYDAWLLGLVNLQLQRMREAADQKKNPAGSYLGAYAWVENLRPAPAPVLQQSLAPDLLPAFTGGPPLLVNPVNGGYVHAPSLPHARTAAVLRAGYMADATAANSHTLAVDLTSDRVRIALSLMEGIRNDQSIGALLGYRFERGLHDRHTFAEVDKYIYPLRKAFPLVADAMKTTATPPGVPIEQIEARNVIDGRKFAEHIRRTGAAAYPFNLAGLPSLPSQAAADAINAEARALDDAYRAISELALAEGVHQAVQGNFERVAATLDAFAGSHQPPEPEVVLSPPSGIALTHRVAVHLRPGLAAPAGATPVVEAEPAVDAWLAEVLPPLSTIGCTVAWDDPVDGTPHSRMVTFADLGVRPLDLIDLIPTDQTQAMTQLDDRVHAFVRTAAPGVRPDATMRIEYRSAPPNGLSVFEAAASIKVLRSIVAGARPLRATDAVRPGDADPDQDAQVALDRNRVAVPLSRLDTLHSDMAALITTLAPLIANPTLYRATILSNLDQYLDSAAGLLARESAFRIPAGCGSLLDWRHNSYAKVIADLRALVGRWDARLADFDTEILAYDGLPVATPEAERFAALRAAEVLLSADPMPQPPTAAQMWTALNATKAAFVARRDQFSGAAKTTVAGYSGLLAEIAALPTLTGPDKSAFDVSGYGDRAVAWTSDLAALLAGHQATIGRRHSSTKAHLDAHDTAADAKAKVEALTAAAKALLGEDFVVIPEFTVGAVAGTEWQNAVTASTSGDLLKYLTQTAGVESPVDEWLYGIARVRPAMRDWESLTMLTDALRGPDHVPLLQPVQFPYTVDDQWLALQFAPKHQPTDDHLCYTAHYSAPFDPALPQCGLLVDEWTEVIPATDRTTGLTFNFQRPDSEPPQAILVVTPASGSGSWQWEDLVGALNDSLDLAKVRAVEPAQIEGTPYATLLPATVMATAVYAISIFTDLGAFALKLKESPHV